MESLPARPRWLDDEAEIAALLHAVVDRFEQQPGEKRSRCIHLPAERYLKSLKRLDESADHQWRLIESLQQLAIIEIRCAKHSSLDAPWSGAKLAFPPSSEPVLRAWLERPAVASSLERWRDVVLHHAAYFPGDMSILLRRRLTISGHSDEEVVTALTKLARFTEPLTLRQMSSALFRGDSKLLDEREELLRTLFPALSIRTRAIVVAVHLPERIEGILFIENQESYITASEGALPGVGNLALVYAAGFRGSAQRIRESDGALLHYCGPGIDHWQLSFEKWWFNRAQLELPLHFFGDLDFSGMQILIALRRRFGDVTCWKPGYGKLLNRLRAEGGHRPDEADKQRQTDPGVTGCNYADEVLLPAMRDRGFLDQEAL